ncbi:MAG: hypothetical protein ACXU86_21680 [Archangium sp.]
MVKAQATGESHSIAMPTPKEAILVMSSSDANRERRAERLHFLAAVAYCHLGVEKLLGVITEPISAELRSYDFILLDGVSFANEAELRREAEKFFGPVRHVTETEFRPLSKADAK